MNININKNHTRWDILLVALILCIAGLIYIFSLNNSDGNIAIIKKNFKILYEIDLNKVKNAYEINLDNNIKIAIDYKKIRIIDSSCQNKTCVNQGWISHQYETIVCLPNLTTIEISNINKKKLESIDGVVY